MRKADRMWIFIVLAGLAALLFAACGNKPDQHPLDGPGMERTYQQIPQNVAARMMKEDSGCVVVDVRRWDEYEDGHIPGAICIPNEEIGDTMPSQLPDLGQEILIYCRSGNRSKQAAEKLIKIGYYRVYEFGGILDWTGEVVEGNEPYGGYEMTPTYTIVMSIGEYSFPLYFETNPAANALLDKLQHESIEIEMTDTDGIEKTGELPWYLPRDDSGFTAELGDITLAEGDQLCIFYGEAEVSRTKIGEIYFWSEPERLLSALGDGDITVEMYLEWTE